MRHYIRSSFKSNFKR